MKTIKTNAYNALITALAGVESDDLAAGVEAEMKDVDSRAIARERAIANLTKDHDYYKKSKNKPKTGESA